MGQRITAHRRRRTDRHLEGGRWKAGEMGVDEVQAAYDKALRRVLAALARTTDIAVAITVDFTEPELQYSYGTTHQSALPGTDDAESAAAELADRVQDDVLDELWGPPWPACPGHSHPAAP